MRVCFDILDLFIFCLIGWLDKHILSYCSTCYCVHTHIYHLPVSNVSSLWYVLISGFWEIFHVVHYLLNKILTGVFFFHKLYRKRMLEKNSNHFSLHEHILTKGYVSIPNNYERRISFLCSIKELFYTHTHFYRHLFNSIKIYT